MYKSHQPSTPASIHTSLPLVYKTFPGCHTGKVLWHRIITGWTNGCAEGEDAGSSGSGRHWTAP